MTEPALASSGTKRSRVSSRPKYLIPVALFLALTVALAWGLTRDRRTIPSALIGKPVPEFALRPVEGRTLGLAGTDLKGEVSLVNIFASWCTACREEHPLFMRLQKDGVVPIHGLNYKDRPADAARWLDALGDPYTLTGADRDPRVAIDWGVYGVEPDLDWTILSNEFEGEFVLHIAAGTSGEQRILYAVTVNPETRTQPLHVSRDDGRSWSPLTEG